jgi:glycosyltransferase involved in cell wall biosynthesis
MHTPSILVDGSSSAENVIDNFNGFLVKNSIESFVAKLRELMDSPERIQIAGLNASLSIARSWESVVEEVLDRYKKLMLRKWRK